MEKRITLKDIAQYTGYSLRTVKKVLSGTEYVSEQTSKEIIDASIKLNYKRNSFASALAKNRTYTVALVYANISSSYFPEIERGFGRCAEEYRDYGIRTEYFRRATGDIGWQISLLNELAARADISAVVVQPMSAVSLVEPINRLADAGKPVITFGSDAPGSKRSCYIGPRAHKSGRIAAQLMANCIGGKGNVCIINRSAEHMQTKERTAGFLQCVNERYPGITVREVSIPVDPEYYYGTVRSLAVSEPVDGFFSTDAEVHQAGRALADLGRKDIALIGYDLSEETCRLMKDGYIDAILYQNPELQGYRSLKTACEMLLNKTIPTTDHEVIDVQIITSECLD